MVFHESFGSFSCPDSRRRRRYFGLLDEENLDLPESLWISRIKLIVTRHEGCSIYGYDWKADKLLDVLSSIFRAFRARRVFRESPSQAEPILWMRCLDTWGDEFGVYSLRW